MAETKKQFPSEFIDISEEADKLLGAKPDGTPGFVLTSSIKKKSDTVTAKRFVSTSGVSYECFERDVEDLSTLANLAGFPTNTATRSDYYESFRDLKLFGFDETKKHTISLTWANTYQYASLNLYRLAIKQFDGSNWVNVFDSGTIDKTVLGVVDGETTEVFLVDDNFGGLTAVKAVIDFNRWSQDAADIFLDTGETPECIIKKSCYVQTSNVEIAPKAEYFTKRQPTHSFIFDDLQDSDQTVFNIFKEYGFLPNFAIQTNRMNDGNVGTYLEFQKQGCSILSHSVTHPQMFNPALITEAEVRLEMTYSKKDLKEKGFVISGWVTPSSSLDISFLPTCEDIYGYGFSGLNAGYYDQTVSPCKMNRVSLEELTLSQLKNRVDTDIAYKQLTVFYAHAVPSISGVDGLSESKLRDFLAYLKTKTDAFKCVCLPTDEAVKSYYEKTWVEKSY